MRFIAIAVASVFLSACAISGPKYDAQPANQATLRNGGFQSAVVGAFTAVSPKLEKLTIRGNPLVATTGTSSGDIRQALELELSRAGLLSADSATKITGILKENDLNGRGVSEGTASISVEFVVHRNEVETYRATKSVEHSWESSFIGAKAIPAASQGYVQTIEKLISSLIADPEFQASIK